MKPPLERNPSKKRHSWWWDSHISPKNSKWLAENLEEMDKQVKEMVQLIEEDGDSFAKKAQMYYQRRPMLITHVENFYRMYRALAERYDNVTGELRKNIPSRMQSQGSLTGSECGSERLRSPSPSPSPELQRSWTREQSPRAAGFEFFLSSKSNDSLSSRKDPESASQSESDAKSEDGEDDSIAYTLHQKIIELEDDLSAANRKLLDANEKLEVFEERSLRCHCDCKENGNGAGQATRARDIQGELEDAAILTEEHSRLLEQNKALEAEIVNLKEEMASAKQHFDGKISESGAEISRYRQELAAASEKLLQEKSDNSSEVGKLQEAIENSRRRLEEVSEEKSLVEEQVKQLEEASAEAEKQRQELVHAAEMLSEDKFRNEAEVLTLRLSIEDLKPKFERIAVEKSLLKSWFADLEHVVERGRSVVME
ncbi:hypothetical protein ACQ4PT_019468 [Festuca glaucescens]